LYENGKMRYVETILGMGEGRIRRMMKGVNSNSIYCKNFYKCHNVPPVQHNNMIIKKRQKKKKSQRGEKNFCLIEPLLTECAVLRGHISLSLDFLRTQTTCRRDLNITKVLSGWPKLDLVI
jgi:hypothetical protein